MLSRQKSIYASSILSTLMGVIIDIVSVLLLVGYDKNEFGLYLFLRLIPGTLTAMFPTLLIWSIILVHVGWRLLDPYKKRIVANFRVCLASVLVVCGVLIFIAYFKAWSTAELIAVLSFDLILCFVFWHKRNKPIPS